MAVSSPPTPLGTTLPDIALPDLDGHSVELRQFADGRPIVVVFACNHCPYVKHVESALGALLAEYPPDRLAVAAVASNDIDSHPDDDIPHLREQQQRAGWSFPYLVDADQVLAHAFGAVCTPDFFVFDREGRLAYRGCFDSSTPGNGEPLTGAELRRAIDAVLNGDQVALPHRPAMGCSIKWKAE